MYMFVYELVVRAWESCDAVHAMRPSVMLLIFCKLCLLENICFFASLPTTDAVIVFMLHCVGTKYHNEIEEIEE